MRPGLVAAIALVIACSHHNTQTPPDSAPTTDAPHADASVDAVDAMATPSELIGYARAAADGSGLSLPIKDATVTYVQAALGNDPAGFAIQVMQPGPALLIAVDPATLSPVPAVGDVVSFTITTMATAASQRRATAITSFTRSSTGGDVTSLVQDLTNATDVVSSIDGYDSELVTVSGTIAGAFASSGNSFQAAAVDTAGVQSNTAYLLRLPTTLRDSLDLAQGCHFTISKTPINRFNSQAELQARVGSELTVTQCPAPVVTNAIALSATTIRVDFSRNIQASSVMADGSQFTFDNGLTASAASVSGRSVTLTTSMQTGGTDYLLTVASTVTDQAGTGVGTPSTFTIHGFVTLAIVRVNEVNANISGGCDLIELRVVSGGSMTGYKIQERTGSAASSELQFTFPAFNVATNAIIVIHENSASATCNPGGATSETGSDPAAQPASSFAKNYDTAFDFYVTDTGLTSTDNVITLYDSANAIVDAVLIDDDMVSTCPPGSNVASASETQAAAVAAANQWQMIGGGIPVAGTGGCPAAGFVDENFRLWAVVNSASSSSVNASGANSESLHRIDNTDDNDKADWAQGANSWGLINPGQTPF